tara:strand:+ start:709 stop:1671 length:963 start_codon:yes stop_codon:yes gene_type:complete
MDAGVVDEVDGIPVRPIPLRRFCWASVPWVSEHGVVRYRHYNARLAAWFWEARPLVPVIDKTGRLGHRLHGQFRTIPQLIALAWLRRRTPMRRMRPVELIARSDGVVAYNLRYADEQLDDTDSDDDDETDEVWVALECKVGIVPCVGTGALISSRGRVRVANAITHGTGGLGGYFCILPSVPPIPISRVTAVLFSSRPRGEKPAPRIREVIRLLKDGANVEVVRREMRIQPNTAWAYVHDAMRFVSTKSAATYTRQMMQDEHVEAPFRKLVDEAPELLHAPLRIIVDRFTRTCMAGDLMWRTNPHRYAELCAMRALVQRE